MILSPTLAYPENFMTQEEFDKKFGFQPRLKTEHRVRRFLYRLIRPCLGIDRFLQFLYSFIPILEWLPRYAWKADLLGDVMGGLTVGIIHVPQGIAYAMLSGLDPVYGLYTSLFAVIFYMIFGTSKYVSIGSFAIVSLMTSVSAKNILQKISYDIIQAEISSIEEAKLEKLDLNLQNISKILPHIDVSYTEVVQSITFFVGVVQLAMGFLRVEFLASYLSDQLVNGFCAGAAVHVIAVQINQLVQVNVPKYSGPGYLFMHMIGFIRRIYRTNFVALGISIASFIFLFIGKDILNPKLKKWYKLPVPIPFELILVIITTGMTRFMNLDKEYNITIIKEIPTRLPQATLPRIDLLTYVILDALEIAFVAVALHLSMCKVFNRKMNSTTDNNQELYALGFIGSLSSFFTTYPITSSLGRSMVGVEAGAKTQLSSLFVVSLLLVVILFIGSLLSTLPMIILAVIIIYSLKSTFLKVPGELVWLWKVSKIDFAIWVFSFVSTVAINVMEGLILSVLFALLTTIFRIQWPRWRILQKLSGTETYQDSGRYARVTNINGIRIFRFDAPLLYINVEHFARSFDKAIHKCCILGQTTTHGHLHETKDVNKACVPVTPIDCSETPTIQHIVIDCSGVAFVDITSVNALADVYQRMQKSQINIYFACVKAHVRDMLDACDFHKNVPKEQFFPSIHDAILCATHRMLSGSQGGPFVAAIKHVSERLKEQKENSNNKV